MDERNLKSKKRMEAGRKGGMQCGIAGEVVYFCTIYFS
jgi:hypothetical protein